MTLTLVPDPNEKTVMQFAQLLCDVAALHENSFNKTTHKYEIPIERAAALVTIEQPWQTPVYLLLATAWNDAIDWARANGGVLP
jgi:hypothetical protein